MKIV
jgi:hypothetical protein